MVCLLGPPRVLVAGEETLGPGAKKVMALLAYLVVEADRPHSRWTLAALLWPDQPPPQALQALRQTLSRLRRALGDGTPSRDSPAAPPHLLIEHQTVQFNRQSDYWLDVGAFRTLLARTGDHRHRRLDACPACVARLGEAAELYCGEFLATFHPAGSPSLDEWLLMQREGLQQQACLALQALASSYLARGEPEEARQYARRLLSLDPWNEAAQRLMLRALLLVEGRNAALQHYNAFRQELAGELGVKPEDATQDLVAQIRTGALTGMRPREPAAFPTPPTPFVGRQAERQRLDDYLASGDRRLLTLYGPGGIGKTRLALATAADQAPLWRDGVWFVPVADVPDPAHLPEALAARLKQPGADRPLDAAQLVGFLRSKELLLILDSFEHLAAGAALILAILRWAPEVRILVTSRTCLGLEGEWALHLGGLEVPPEPVATVADAEGCSAVQLFVQSARRAAPDFALSPTNLPHVVRICRLVAGLPLGIELAAAWVRLFPSRQIADQIQKSPDFLHNPRMESTERHHSLRATFQYSYKLLPRPEQVLFRRLSVFRGGFTPDAASQVVGASPSQLSRLLDRSLLQALPSRRLDLHPVLRDYAAEELASGRHEEWETRARHCRTYLSFVQEREGLLRGEDPKEVLEEIEAELGNLRQAWGWALSQAWIEEIEASIGALSHFYDLAGMYREALELFGSAADRMLVLAPEEAAAWRARGRLLVEQSRFLLQSADYARASKVAESAAGLAHRGQDDLAQATARRIWGEALWRQGDHPAARSQLESALVMARTVVDTAGTAGRAARQVEIDCLSSLGAACWIHGDRDQARGFLQQALQMATADHNRHDEAKLLTSLGVCALEEGRYAEARDRFRQSLSMRRALGDRRGESITLGNLGNLLLYLGAYAQARAHYERALCIQQQTGARNDEALSVGNMSLVYHYLGEDGTALEYSRQALQIAQETGELRTEGAMWMKLGHALAGLGVLDEAARAYQNSVALRRQMGWTNVATEPLAGLARVALAVGDLAQAEACAREILEHLATGTLDGTIAPLEILLTCYRVLAAADDPRAGQVLDMTHERLQERAARISDREMQRSFLEDVPYHREIVRALAAARGEERG